MTRFKSALMCGAAATLAFAAAPANAATIVLVDQGGVTGSPAQLGFQIAANYWASLFTNNVTIKLGVRFAPLAPNVIGSTGSSRQDFSVANWEAGINATKSNSAIDQNIVLPTLTSGGATFITNGVDGSGNDDTTTYQVINGDSVSSKTLYLNTAVVKAVGGTASYAGSNPNQFDGNVTFSSNFAFDFNPTDGITAGTFDFIGVAIHEIGHALGFVSGVDFLDVYGKPNGPGAGTLGYSLNDTSIYSALDMFRYSNDPNGLVDGDGNVLDLSVGGTKFFSIDGGQTALFGNTFSTGAYNGDGRQASHWKDTPMCQVGNGIMDPTFCFGQMGVLTGLDLAAFDAMGWNLSTAATGDYRLSTRGIFMAAVPEPATWAMMIAGFGMVGAQMRRRRPKVKVTYA